MGETWRVVLAGGSVREVRVEINDDGRVWAESDDGTAEGSATDARMAVQRVVRFLGITVREILAPGEPTRAEAIAAVEGRLALATAAGEALACDLRRVSDDAQRAAEMHAAAVAAAVERCAQACDEAAGAEESIAAAERADGDETHAEIRMTRASALRQMARAIRAGGV